MKQNHFTSLILILLALNFSHCTSNTTDSGSTTSTTVTNLEAVSNNLTPASLNYTQNSSSVSATPTKAAAQGNPCAVVDNDLFACQPILLQLYMDLAQEMLDHVIDIISGVGTAMGTVEDGASGTSTWHGITVQYSKTSATDYSILLLQGSTGLGYVDVSENTYTLKMDLDSIGQGGSGQFETVVNYTDADTWTINLLLAAMECEADDVAAPERIKLVVNKANGVWTGKAMLYNGVWRDGDATCSTEAADDTSMTFYTDFVANDTAAKASLYSMPRDKTDLGDIADWGMDSFEDNFGDGFGDTSPYINPFCNPAGTLEALWNNNCSAYDATMSAASYSSADNWVTPNALYQLEVDVPDNL